MRPYFDINQNSNIGFHRITNKVKSEQLFAGYDEIQFISFATSLHTLLKMFNSFQFKKVQGIIGSFVTDQFKDELKADREKVSEILENIKSKKWLLHINGKNKPIIHDKFYMLRNKDCVRIIIGSPNLTESGIYASRQVNNSLVIDYKLTTSSENEIKKFQDYYMENLKSCELFMEDLVNQIENEGDDSEYKRKIINRWLDESNEEVKEREVKKFIRDVHDQAIQNVTESEQNTLVIDLPENKDTLDRISKIFPKDKFERTTDNQMIISSGVRYFKWITKNIGYPLMFIKERNKERKLYLFSDKLQPRTVAPTDIEDVDLSLKNLEDFCNTVELGQTDDSLKAKMIFYETILYFLNASFSHELMKIKKKTVGHADDSGMKYLFIIGKGSNSKTQIIKLMLKILTGHIIKPIDADKFTAGNIRHIAKLGTVFPIIADDVIGRKLNSREEILKNYWEKEWEEECETPQIIISTNNRNMANKPWARRRIMPLDFEVAFKRNQDNSKKLNEIISAPNNIFLYYSFYFLNKIDTEKHFKIEDELNIAREIMKLLYEYAGRTIPPFFPNKPIEEIYDKNWELWKKTFKYKKAKIRYHNGNAKITFTNDMNFQIQRHYDSLPQTIVAERHGNQIIIENSNVFKEWYYRESNNGIFKKLFKTL